MLAPMLAALALSVGPLGVTPALAQPAISIFMSGVSSSVVSIMAMRSFTGLPASTCFFQPADFLAKFSALHVGSVFPPPVPAPPVFPVPAPALFPACSALFSMTLFHEDSPSRMAP